MNVPPKEFVRVAPDRLRAFVAAVFDKVGLCADDACFLADLLVGSDLRGIFSHGSRTTLHYGKLFRDGRLNPRPAIKVARETPVSALVDGDGGLGHFACHRAALLAVEKARAVGIAVTGSFNHGHIGGAGKYVRLALPRDLIAFCVSGHQILDRSFSNHYVLTAAGGSPICFAIPGGKEGPPIVIDMGTHTVWPGLPKFEEYMKDIPWVVFKGLGLGAVCQALGGFLVGLETLRQRDHKRETPNNQGSLHIMFRTDLFMKPAEFRRQIADYVAKAQQFKPFPGQDRAVLPGTLEWERERDWSRDGVPVGGKHQEALLEAARTFGVPAPC